MATKYTYDKDKDYQAMINEAVAQGDYQSAALYEQQRNQKIADKNAAGTNTKNHQQTDLYSSYLNPQIPTTTKSDPKTSANYNAWENALNAYQNSKFTYDFDSDPQKKVYERQAQGNFDNTLAQLSARTGGLASSYAGQASQQAYQSTMDQAYQILYDIARNNYDSEQNKKLNVMNQYWNAYQNELNLADTDWNRALSTYQLGQNQQQQALENSWTERDYTDTKKEQAALIAAYTGDYSGLADFYGVTEDAARSYFMQNYGATGGSGGGAAVEEDAPWQSARSQMLAQGVPVGDAMAWLIDHGYSKTEAEAIAETYTNGWIAYQGLQGNELNYTTGASNNLVSVPGYGEITYDDAERLEEQGLIEIVGYDSNGNIVYQQTNKKPTGNTYMTR